MVKILYSAHGLQIKTKDALITNTYGTGYYRIQDIDGDGKLDEEEANNEQSLISAFRKLQLLMKVIIK